MAFGRTRLGWLDADSIKTLACADLRMLNQLWTATSGGKFGFSAQKALWLELGGGRGCDTMNQLGDAIGWRKNGAWLNYNYLTFDLHAAPVAHLPRVWKIKAWSEQFLLRVQVCEL
ncbi:MAG: GUN4 domain-containing protein [Spirulinaceae cyanobacterium SM2_1_0]|nr:GUN4 domain-containing protein [Spirulinaceae cyanobacterium SM2_1_0]